MKVWMNFSEYKTMQWRIYEGELSNFLSNRWWPKSLNDEQKNNLYRLETVLKKVWYANKIFDQNVRISVDLSRYLSNIPWKKSFYWKLW